VSAHTLHWRVDRLAELMEERAWKEYDDYYDAANAAAVGGGGFVSMEMTIDDFRSPIDARQLFQPFLDMPLPESFDDEIAQLRNARQNVADAYNDLVTRLGPSASSWVSDAGEAFNTYITTLTRATTAHVSVLEDLERLLVTYRDLLEEAWKAAKQLASGIIDKLKHMDADVDFDWSTLLHLGLAAAGALNLAVDPPVGVALIIGSASGAVNITEAGNSVVHEIAVGGSNVRDVMESTRTAVHKLERALRAKGATLSETLDTVPSVLHDASARVMPAPPALPVG
jgi:uncharacterized protein YukE